MLKAVFWLIEQWADDLWRCFRVIIKSIITASHVNFPGMPSFTYEEEKKVGKKRKLEKKWQMGSFSRWVIILYPTTTTATTHTHHRTPTPLSSLFKRMDKEDQVTCKPCGQPGPSHTSSLSRQRACYSLPACPVVSYSRQRHGKQKGG